MNNWIVYHYQLMYPEATFSELTQRFGKLQFAVGKPQADVYIDDRALPFNGDWSEGQFSIDNLVKFRPWNRAS